MKNLDYFRTNQDDAPSWAIKKNTAYRGIISQADMDISQGMSSTLMGKASVVFDDPGQLLNQTVVWGNTIKIASDKSHLVVDGVKIDLPSVQPQKKDVIVAAPPVASVASSTNNAPSSSANRYASFYTPVPQADPRNITVSAIDNRVHPEGIRFENIVTGNRFNMETRCLEQYKTGTVVFKNGNAIPIGEYELLSDEERTRLNDMPSNYQRTY